MFYRTWLTYQETARLLIPMPGSLLDLFRAMPAYQPIARRSSSTRSVFSQVKAFVTSGTEVRPKWP